MHFSVKFSTLTEEKEYAPITAPEKDIHLPKEEDQSTCKVDQNDAEVPNKLNEEEENNKNNPEEEEKQEAQASTNINEEEDNEEEHKESENAQLNEEEDHEEEHKESENAQLNEEEEQQNSDNEKLDEEEEEDQIESRLIQEENEKLNELVQEGEEESYQDSNADDEAIEEESAEEYKVSEPTQQRPPRSARASYNHPISPRSPRVPTQEELDKATSVATQFVLGNEVEERDPFILALAIRNLNERYTVLGDGGTYEDTVRVAHAIDAAKAKHREVVIEMAKDNSLNWVRIKQRQNENDLENWRNMNFRVEGTLNRKSKNAINEMKKRHQEERQLFEEEWASETRMKYFSKASDQLRQLRKLQIRLLQDRKFEDSERVKKIAKKLEGDEVAANMLAWSQAKREAFLLMENRQRKQMDTLVKSLEVKKQEFLAKKKNEEIVLNNRIRALKIQEKDASNPEKNWIRHHRNEGDVAFREIGPGQRVKINPDTQKKNIFTLAMPPPPKSNGSGAWRPLTKKNTNVTNKK